MTDRARSRWVNGRSALVTFVAVTVLAAGGVWFSQATQRTPAVADAPKTSAAQEVKTAGKPAGGLPGVRDCGIGEPVVEPKVITLTCADAGMVATQIKWDRYGPKEAEGKGVVQVEKTAAGAGSNAVFPATFHLDSAKQVEGARVFTTLVVNYEGSTPLGSTAETYPLA